MSNSSDSNSDSNSRKELIEKVADEFLTQLRKGGEPASAWIKRHPDLAPELEHRLREIEQRLSEPTLSSFKIDGGSQETQIHESSDEVSILAEKLIDVCCPNCGVDIHIVERADQAEVTCHGCGSTIEIKSQRTYSKPAPVGRNVGRFKILDVLGQGGFGTVYKARDPNLDRLVALKVPRLGFFDSANQRARFIREAKNAARLRHDNIIQVYEILEDGELPVIVTEYIEGLSLSDLCNSRRMETKSAAELVVKISEAIHFAHENGVIHRDIKPSNILLDTEMNPHVADFGLARDMLADITMTVDGEILGTPAYMSPEQARGDNSQTDHRTDVYSLGVVLFQLLTGELPFRGSRRMLMHQVINEEPQPVRKLNDSVPRDLEVIVAKALHKDKDRRYETSKALADDLERHLAHKPILAQPDGIFRRIAKWHRRQPVVSGLIATVATLLLVGGALATVWALRERNNGLEIQKSLNTNRQYLRKIFVQNGSTLLKSNQSLSSLSWFQKTLEESDSNIDQSGKQPENQQLENDYLRIHQIVDNNPTLVNVWGVGDRVGSVQYSSDGKRIIATDDESTLVIIDAEKGIVHQLNHPGKIRRANISNSGELATCIVDSSVHVWNVTTGQRVALLDHDKTVLCAEFNQNSNELATGSMGGKTITWNPATGEKLKEFVYPESDEPDVNLVLYSNDGMKLVTVSSLAKSSIRIWDVESGKIERVLTHEGRVSTIDTNDSFGWLASGSDDETVKVWNLSNENLEPKTLDHKSAVRHLEFLNDSTIVSLAYDGNVKKWNLAEDIQSGFLVDRNITTMFASIGLAGEVVITGCTDGDVRANWIRSGAALCGRLPHGTTVMSVDFHPEGRRFVAGGNDGAIRQWDLAGLAPAALLQHNDHVLEATFTLDSSKVITCSLDHTARIWDLSSTGLGTQLGPALEHAEGISDVAISADQTHVITSSFDKTLNVWELATGNSNGESYIHLDGVKAVAASPTNGQFFVSGSQSGNGIAWKIPQAEKRFSFNHGAGIEEIVYSKTGKYFASASLDGVVNIWDEMGKKIGGPLQHEGAIHFLDFDPKEDFLVASGDARHATIWKLSDLNQPFQILPHSDGVWGAAFSHDGSMLLTTDIQGTATLWQRKGLAKFVSEWSREFSFAIGFGAFSPNDQVIAISAFKPSSQTRRLGSSAVIVLDSKTGDELSPPLPMLERMRRVRFSPKGDLLVSVSNDSSARIWPLKKERLDSNKLKNLAVALTGKTFDSRMDLVSPLASEIELEFKNAQRAFPNFFEITENQIQRWETYAEFILNSKKTNKRQD